MLKCNTITIHKLLKIRAYLAQKSVNSSAYSNYYLLGYRENYIFLRLQSVVESLEKLNNFFKALRRQNGAVWVGVFDPKMLRLSRWLARIADVNLFIDLRKRGFLIHWANRYFLIRTNYFKYNIARYLGVDALVLLGGEVNTKVLIQFLNQAIPIIAVSPPGSIQIPLTYQVPYGADSPQILVFYVRVLAFLLA